MRFLLAARDDGPLAEAVGRRLGPHTSSASAPLTVLGVAPLLAVALTPAARSVAAVGAALAWCLLAAGAAAGRAHDGRLDWAVPGLLRVAEYVVLLRLTIAEGASVPTCFALLSVLAYHHYDIAYRVQHRGAGPPVWLRRAAGGWDMRLVAAAVLAAVGGLDGGVTVGAILLAVLVVGESVVSWLRFVRRPLEGMAA